MTRAKRNETEFPGTAEAWIRNETELVDTVSDGTGTKRNYVDTIRDGLETGRTVWRRILIGTDRNETKRYSTDITRSSS